MKRFAYIIESHNVIECIELAPANLRMDMMLLNQMSKEYFGDNIRQTDMTGEVQHFIANHFGRIVVTREQHDDDTVVGFFPPTPIDLMLDRVLR